MTVSSAAPVVFVTGSTGFVGSATIFELIKREYRVKAVVRSQSKADAFIEKYPAESASIEWAIVPDLTDETALSAAAEGVDHIIHMACPFYFDFADPVKDILEPARDVTLAVLRAAAKHPRIKRVVITSSFVAVWDVEKDGGLQPGKTFTEQDWNPATWEQAAESKNPFSVVSASKSLAEKAAYDFVDCKRSGAGFSLTTFCPPILWGPPLQPGLTTKNLNTSLDIIWQRLTGQHELGQARMPIFVDVRDLAYLQVAALTNENAKNQRYLAASGPWFMEKLVQIMKEEFPQQAYRLPPTVRTAGPEHFDYDVSKTQRDFPEMNWIPLRKTLVDTMRVLYEMEKEENAKYM